MRKMAYLVAALILAMGTSAEAMAAVEVADAALSTNVVDRNPQGVSNEFSTSVGRIYCFTKVVGMEKGEVLHRWIRNGKTEFEIKLPIGGSSWRVWSAKSVYPESVGSWKVEVLDTSNGMMLKTLEFRVKP